MKAARLTRDAISAAGLDGAVVVADVLDADDRVAIDRGTRLRSADCSRLLALPWTELHLVWLEEGDLGEHDAGTRLARAAAGAGTVSGECTGGHWPIVATWRGVVRIEDAALARVNELSGLAVYTLPEGQVVDAGDVVARAKILPFVVAGDTLAHGEEAAGDGLVRVLPFLPGRVSAIVQESIGSSALARFRRTLTEKVEWFGGTLGAVLPVAPDSVPIAGAITRVLTSGVDLVVMAGARAMDPLDPAFGGIEEAGGRVERVGVPAHPGSLLWLARVGDVPLVGMPSCGLFSRATVFDVVLSRLMAGLPVDAAWLAGMGHGGLLTRDMAWRFPPYRPRQDRGAVE